MSDQLPVDITIDVAGAAAALQMWQQQNAAAVTFDQTLQKSHHSARQLRDEMGRFTQAAQQGGKEAGAAITSSAGTVRDFVSAFTGIGSVVGGVMKMVQAIKAEWDDMVRRQGEAAGTQISTAAAQKEAYAGLGKDPNLSTAEFDRRVAEIAQRTGASASTVYRASSTAFGFGGAAMSKDRMLEAAAMAAEATPDDEATVQANTKAMLTIMGANQAVSAKDAFGFMMAGKEFSPTVSEEAFGSNIAPTVAKLQQFGDSPEEAMSMLAAMGIGIGDEEGRVTANASINLAKQLAEIPSLAKMEGGTMGRIRALQTPEFAKERRKLLGVFDKQGKSKAAAGLTGEAKAFTTMVSFLNGEGAANDTLQATLQEMPSLEGAGTRFDEFQGMLAESPLQKVAQRQRMERSAAERKRLLDTEGGMLSVANAGLDENLRASGANLTERTLIGGAMRFAGPEAAATVAGGIKTLSEAGFGALAPGGKADTERLGEVIEQLRELNATQKETSVAMGNAARGMNPEAPVQPAQAALGRKK